MAGVVLVTTLPSARAIHKFGLERFSPLRPQLVVARAGGRQQFHSGGGDLGVTARIAHSPRPERPGDPNGGGHAVGFHELDGDRVVRRMGDLGLRPGWLSWTRRSPPVAESGS